MPKTREHSTSNPQSGQKPTAGQVGKSQMTSEKDKKKTGSESWSPEKPITKK